MAKRKRKVIERRFQDRRKGYNLELMDRIGLERRKSERRDRAERRNGWLRLDGFTSIRTNQEV